MGIYIKGMEMPQEGTFNIVHIYSDGRVAIPFWGKGMQVVQGIEAAPVPKHGRLIDADALPLEESVPTVMMHDGERWISAYELAMAPIVIPADLPKEEV